MFSSNRLQFQVQIDLNFTSRSTSISHPDPPQFHIQIDLNLPSWSTSISRPDRTQFHVQVELNFTPISTPSWVINCLQKNNNKNNNCLHSDPGRPGLIRTFPNASKCIRVFLNPTPGGILLPLSAVYPSNIASIGTKLWQTAFQTICNFRFFDAANKKQKR